MPAKITEVQRGIYELFLPLPMRPTIVNVYLIDCGGGQWTLVDTGMNTADSVATLKDAFVQAGTRRATVTSRVLALDLDHDALPSRLATASTIPLATGTFSSTT